MVHEPLINEIVEAFEDRKKPATVLIQTPLAGDDLPPGHPGFGLGEPIPENETDAIIRGIQGRDWQSMFAPDLTWALVYMTPEAICYYLPAILIYNLEHEFSIETVNFVLQPLPRRLSPLCEPIFRQLSSPQRRVVACYMKLDPEFTPEDVAWWEQGNDRSSMAREGE